MTRVRRSTWGANSGWCRRSSGGHLWPVTTDVASPAADWINGGTTDLANLTLLCRAHHRVVHHGGWDIIMGADQHPRFLPPEWMDPLREPRPAHHRQPHLRFTAA